MSGRERGDRKSSALMRIITVCRRVQRDRGTITAKKRTSCGECELLRWQQGVMRRLLIVGCVVLLGTITESAAPGRASEPTLITGGITTHIVAAAETLTSIAARSGVDPSTIVSDNRLAADGPLEPGGMLLIDNRHIVPPTIMAGEIVVNVPQRMLFYREGDRVLAYPVAVGRATWQTPRGAFTVTWKDEDPAWHVPASIRAESARKGRELPLGVIVIATVLFITALVNFFTKYTATIGGVLFSLVFFALFTYSERRVARQRAGKPEGLDQFRVYGSEQPENATLGVRPGNILVAVRDPKNLYYLREVLRRTDTTQQDVVVMTARLYHREHSFGGNTMFEASQVFDHYEQELFTASVAAAEKEGRPISLLVVPASDVFDAIIVTAQRLESSRIVCGLSNKLTPDEQAKLTGDAWERLPDPKPRLVMEVRLPNGVSREYYLGPHAPRLRNQDLDLLHRLWLEITSDPRFAGAHHYHVIAVALAELERELNSGQRSEVLDKLWQELQKRSEDDL